MNTTTNNRPAKKSPVAEFIEEYFLYIIIGAVIVGFGVFLLISNKNAPTTDDLKNQFVSIMVRSNFLEEYDSSKREEIAECVFFSSDIIHYRQILEQKNHDDNAIISTYTPVPKDSFLTSFQKYVDDEDRDALLSEEVSILRESTEGCANK